MKIIQSGDWHLGVKNDDEIQWPHDKAKAEGPFLVNIWKRNIISLTRQLT
ncbi:recombination-related endonuclease II [Yersinia phage vB_YenM_TG1]|uniref:Recombination-related endonuclease II n=1 Tax=Yersinia phage vB_YenM_TG1 TaxID=1589265 RepID=A0A0B4ZX36_9CAUD|nr:recombination-related endonuclease II [Yersinia phage vB_YenM_TG1]AJD81877.1 recombination-related endonuclease II [Yersinia phage vB_YenM_TG1]